MIRFARWLGHRALLALDPEQAHGLSIAALRSGVTLSAPPPAPSERLRVRLCGLDFPNPLGMAAGYDKNAEVPDALLSLGFGFAEVGTVTPLPQPGNPKPRIFRLVDDQAVINRLGFNNEGHDACIARLRERPQRVGIVGVNIGANKDSADRMADYELGVRRFAPLASYLTVNVSSPNTPGLRDLQARGALAELLSRVDGRPRVGPEGQSQGADLPQDRARPGRRRPGRCRGRGERQGHQRRHRLQHDAVSPPRGLDAPGRARPAACRASRSSSVLPRSSPGCDGCSARNRR